MSGISKYISDNPFLFFPCAKEKALRSYAICNVSDYDLPRGTFREIDTETGPLNGDLRRLLLSRSAFPKFWKPYIDAFDAKMLIFSFPRLY